MTLKGFIVLFFLVVAILLFALVGFDIARSTKYDLVAVGLASAFAGVLVNWFMPGPLTTAA